MSFKSNKPITKKHKEKKVKEVSPTWGPNTLNNYDDGDIAWLKSLEVSVLTCSKEVCPDTGTPHLQFSVTFKRAYRLAGLRKLHGRVSWRIQDCPQDNNYCRKRDSELIINIDNRKKKGQRTDLETAREIVSTTHSMRAVCQAVFNYQAYRTAEIWLKYCEPQRPRFRPDVFWLHGASNTGKSHYPYLHHEDDEIFIPKNYKWWEGYDGHKVVLIQEFRQDYCTFHQLLELLDRYPFRLEHKGGSRQVQFTTLYITSCYHWRDVYDTPEDLYQLERRISKTIHFKALISPKTGESEEITQV